MSNVRFSLAPNINIPRSKFKMPFNHSTSFNHGDLIPVECFEVLPGDSFSCNFSSVLRMTTPIAPIFGNIRYHIHAFFVPMRLIYMYTEEFYGANKTNAGPQLSSYSLPQRSIFTDGIDADSLSHYLGKPCCNKDTSKVSYGLCSPLKERGYYLIWNEWYRAQQLQAPILNLNSSSSAIGSDGVTPLTFKNKPKKVNKEFDYFTACTISPQYGAAVSLPLGLQAPVKLSTGTGIGPGWIADSNTGNRLGQLTHAIVSSGNSNMQIERTTLTPGGYDVYDPNGSLYADLSNATAATINQLRYAFAVQKYLERSNFGSRFFEMLSAHYGVTSPDSRLQRPEFLGELTGFINVSQVNSTAGYSSGSSTTVGQPGATSTTGIRGHLFSKGFVEPGYVYVLISTTHERGYSTGLMREDTKSSRFEFYSPEFANLGDQAVLKKELFVAGSSVDEGVFGYQEHWAEYRYRPNRVSGLLDPVVANSLDFWSLSDKYTGSQSLTGTWLVEDRNQLARALTTGVSGPDYIGDFRLDLVATREMGVYTIPGLIDHFGIM